jgi:hypothetical protein
MFQAGVTDGDQFGVFGGNGELCREYICLNVAESDYKSRAFLTR